MLGRQSLGAGPFPHLHLRAAQALDGPLRVLLSRRVHGAAKAQLVAYEGHGTERDAGLTAHAAAAGRCAAAGWCWKEQVRTSFPRAGRKVRGGGGWHR